MKTSMYVCRLNTQTGHMFHPCSLAKVICADVKSDKWFMWHLWDRERESSEFLQCIKREWKEGKESSKEDGSETRESGLSYRGAVLKAGDLCLTQSEPLLHIFMAQCLHFPQISSHQPPPIPTPKAQSHPARQHVWQTQHPVTALSNASYSSVQQDCFSVHVFYLCAPQKLKIFTRLFVLFQVKNKFHYI